MARVPFNFSLSRRQKKEGKKCRKAKRIQYGQGKEIDVDEKEKKKLLQRKCFFSSKSNTLVTLRGRRRNGNHFKSGRKSLKYTTARCHQSNSEFCRKKKEKADW